MFVVGLPYEKATVVGHPHAQDLIVFPLNDFLRDDPLLSTIRVCRSVVVSSSDDGVSDVEIVLRRL